MTRWPDRDSISAWLFEPEDTRTDEEREDDEAAAITELKHRKLWAQAREKERNEIPYPKITKGS